MDEADSDFARRIADRIGSGVERSLAGILDELEDLSLWLMEHASDSNVPEERLAKAADTVRRVHYRTQPVPQRVGRFAATATLIGARLGSHLRRAIREVADEVSGPAGRDRHQQLDPDGPEAASGHEDGDEGGGPAGQGDEAGQDGWRS